MIRARLILASVAVWVTAMAIACAPALAASSSASAYGGQGLGLTPIAPHPGGPPDGTLPFTGLDLGLVLGAAAILVLSGGVLRWRLHNVGRGGDSA